MAYEFYRHGEPNPCLLVNPEPPQPVMTVPIVGVPRGGTTMVAAVVHAMGIDLGPAKDLSGFTFEDQQMTQADLGIQMSYIKQRNKERKVWGWKAPGAISEVQSIFFSLRNPRMIMVFRDMVASIDGEMRFDAANNIQPQREFSDLAQATLNWWTDNMKFLFQTAFPVLLVSYERVLKAPETFIHNVGKFLGVPLTHAIIQDALARINPLGGYLRMDEQGHPIQIVEPLPETISSPVVETPEPPAEPAA